MGTHYSGTESEVRALNAFIKLMRAAHSTGARLNVDLTGAGLTESQFGVLEALYHLGPLHPCDLGAKLLCSSGNMTRNNIGRRYSTERRPENRKPSASKRLGRGLRPPTLDPVGHHRP